MAKKKENKPYTTEDIKKSIQVMEDEKLDLTAPVEVSIEGDSDVYEVESLGHFHVIPNMTISLKLKGYTKKNGDYSFTLRRFLDIYNFREMRDNKQDTQIVRIYDEFPSTYIELGVDQWNSAYSKNDIISSFINKKMLERTVESFNYDSDRNIFCVHLNEVE